MKFPKEVVKGKKFAVYLRKSEGEGGSTAAQLERIKRDLIALEKASGRKINRSIVGKDIKKKRRFSADRDLALKGDVFNEGEKATGFKTANRPVFLELLRRIEEGQYDGIVVESFDRISRDILGLAHLALPIWREDGKVILDLSTGKVLGVDREEEALQGIVSLAGSLTKVAEIKKSDKGLKTAIDDGFLTGFIPEHIGYKAPGKKVGRNTALDYRRAWALMQAYGESFNKRAGRNTLNKPSAIGAEFGKDNKWASLYYAKFKNWKELGVLDAWFDAYDALNDYIIALGEQSGSFSRRVKESRPVGNILYATRGFFAYPAGVLLAKDNEFVKFPQPLAIGLDRLALTNESASDLDDFVVERMPYDGRELNVAQTQPRARK